MKVLICVGSYRKNGNTDLVAAMVVQSLRQLAKHNDVPLHVETVYLAHQDIRPCRGCRICFDKSEDVCPLRDDVLAIKAMMKEADGLIIAGPVYVNDVNGVVKNWLDRLAHVCHRPEFAGKCAYLITTVGNGPTNHAQRTLRMALGCWGYHIVGQSGFKMGARMKPQQAQARFAESADGIANTMFESIHSRAYAKPSFLSLMTFKIQQRVWQRTVDDSVDLAYWHSRGWTEVEREFYIPHTANRFKVRFARLTGTLIARLVT